MTVASLTRRALAVVALVSLAVPAPAQTQTPAKPFEPTVGQAGKDVVWVPTPQPLVDKMLDLAKLTPQDFHMDLGSGDGRTVITAAKRGARSVGIEYNPDMGPCRRRTPPTPASPPGPSSARPTCSRPTSRRPTSSRCSCCRRST